MGRNLEDFIELRINELREQQGISWAELSRRSGVDKSMLSLIKNGQKRTLTLIQEEKLAKAFGISISELYTEKINW
jgi:transcriptional regulator with XRE-family HTH domain